MFHAARTNVQFAEHPRGVTVFGYDSTGVSSAVHIKNIPTYISVAIPSDGDCQSIIGGLSAYFAKIKAFTCLRTRCECSNKKKASTQTIYDGPCIEEFKEHVNPIVGWKCIQRWSNMGYERDKRSFLQIELVHTAFVPYATKYLEKIEELPSLLRGVYGVATTMLEYLMSSKNLSSFVSISTDNFRASDERLTRCVHEYEVDYAHVKVVADPTPYTTRVLCLDIETIAERYTDNDMIGMIACQCGDRRVVLSACESFTEPLESGWTVEFYATEKEMLEAFVRVVLAEDPDFIAGYNIEGFDMTRIIRRCETLGVDARFSRMLDPVFMLPVTRSSNQTGTFTTYMFHCPGRVVYDALVTMRKSMEKYRSYKLGAIAKEFELEVQKGDVDYKDIPRYFKGTAEMRHALVKYNSYDVIVTLALMDKCNMIQNLIASCQVTMTRSSDFMSRGQTFKYRRALRSLIQDDYIILNVPYEYEQEIRVPALIRSVPDMFKLYDEKYEGGFVAPPVKDLHLDAVIVLDFSSLYPTIMRAHNLCTTTILKSKDYAKSIGLTEADYEETPGGFLFVKKHVREGLLPRLVAYFMDERNKVKKQIKMEKDDSARRVLKSTELALKVSANSVYGMLGAKTNTEGAVPIAAAVTEYGRTVIQAVAAYILKEHPELQLVYGDTDSVMFKVPPTMKDLNQVMDFADLMARQVNLESGLIVAPMSIAVDKILRPMLLEGKKKYAGLKISRGDGPNGFKTDVVSAGLETVRRDNPKYISESLGELIAVMFDVPVLTQDAGKSDEQLRAEAMAVMQQRLIDFSRDRFSQLLLDKVPLEKLVSSAEIKRPFDEYANKPVAVHVAERVNATGKYAPLCVGDRIEFYYVATAGRDLKMSDRALSPLEYDPTKHALDFKVYAEKMFKPFERALENVLTERQLKTLFDLRTYAIMEPNWVKVSSMARWVSTKSSSMYVEQGAHKKLKLD